MTGMPGYLHIFPLVSAHTSFGFCSVVHCFPTSTFINMTHKGEHSKLCISWWKGSSFSRYPLGLWRWAWCMRNLDDESLGRGGLKSWCLSLYSEHWAPNRSGKTLEPSMCTYITGHRRPGDRGGCVVIVSHYCSWQKSLKQALLKPYVCIAFLL